jgi:hypothetical protein
MDDGSELRTMESRTLSLPISTVIFPITDRRTSPSRNAARYSAFCLTSWTVQESNLTRDGGPETRV